jgi:predicted AlkP superfamily pyrophosphatase or phosphodiesterase|uniref:alkaline phosphatase family protein n=1 Tax=Fluviicola sp. TaxID=1917219 RepID=UPI0040491A4A
MKLKLLVLFFLCWTTQSVFSQKDAPKLVVGIVIDQMCYDYLYRFYPNFGKAGFKRLMDKGSHFRNVTYNYVPTFTGPGHASIYTGTTPSNHGIIGNDWFHRPYNRGVNCVDDTSVIALGTQSVDGLCSPHFLRANTITDQLRLTYPSSKVIGVSLKDRGAILPAGHLANGAYWYDYSSGKFISSSFYFKSLPTWVTDFSAQHPIASYLAKPWNLLKDSACYYYRKMDDSPYEVLIAGKNKPIFPYTLSELPYDQQLTNFTAFPEANTYLTDFAVAAMNSENLGKHTTTDFLTISYSTPDIAGHAFGPYSLEMEDMYFRLDNEIARLLTTLDKQVGNGNYVVFLTADHAVVPVPELLVDHQLPGGYLFLADKEKGLRDLSQQTYQVDVIDRIENANIYLKKEFLNTPLTNNYLNTLKEAISQWSETKLVLTKVELQQAPVNNWAEMMQAGYDPERSGDLIFILQPGFLPKSTDTPGAHKGTSHGSAFNYDTHVPVLFYGKDIPQQDVFTPYSITDIAATVVHILDVQRPNAMIGKPMLELFLKR